MPYAVSLFLDEESSAIVTGIWRKLADMKVSESLFKANFRPHITLGISEKLEIEPFRKYLTGFAGTHMVFPVILSSIGVFPAERNGAVFFGVTPSPQLLQTHDDFTRSFGEFGDNIRKYYRPGHWVPHCTLADGISCDLVPRAMEICQKTQLPIYCLAREIGVLKFPPGYELLAYSLRSDIDGFLKGV